MSYTKGEWKAYTNEDKTFSHVFIPGKYCIAIIESSNPDDACLIASAPEMYEALRDLVIRLHAHILDYAERESLAHAIRILAKAEGKEA